MTTTTSTSSNDGESIKAMVREKYSAIAEQSREENSTSCCGAGECGTVDYAVFAEDYSNVKGYNSSADLGLGCGLPTEFAVIREGDTVVDLGSGAGNDCFIARAITGERGTVIGIDMTTAMIEKARANAKSVGFTNVEFRLGDIESIPIADKSADVVVSNCVFNLVPNKRKAFEETFRILKPGGHFSVSDVVLRGALPDQLRNDAEMYAGCVAGAIQRDEYLLTIFKAGFKNVEVQKERRIDLPAEILGKYLSAEEITRYSESEQGIYSVTVYAERPTQCCEPGTGCC